VKLAGAFGTNQWVLPKHHVLLGAIEAIVPKPKLSAQGWMRKHSHHHRPICILSFGFAFSIALIVSATADLQSGNFLSPTLWLILPHIVWTSTVVNEEAQPRITDH